MFTGIVTHVGEVAEVREMDGGRELVVASDLPLAELAAGRLGLPRRDLPDGRGDARA